MAEKEKPVVEAVEMTDGRVVEFAGKRRMYKEVLINGSEVSVRFDFRNGETRSYTVSPDLLYQLAGHGASQKIGDETAGVEEVEDMVVAVDAIIERLNKGEFKATREAGDSYAGAGVVIRAIAEVTGKDVATVKAFLDGKLEAAKAAGQTLSRIALYASFRNPETAVGKVIARLEADKKKKAAKVDAEALLEELS